MQADLPSTARKLAGLAFEIPDLLLAQAVAEARGLRLVVETDHHTDCDELEEVLAFYPANGDACRFLIWRSAVSVVVQPIPGRPGRFPSLGDALEWLSPDRPKPASDIACKLRQRHPEDAQGPKGGGWDWHSAEL